MLSINSVVMAPNVGACAVAGIGGLGNEAKRNAKTDQLRPVPRYNVNKENESYEDTEPGYCTSTVLGVVPAIGNFKHGCKGFGCVSASVAFALVRIK